MSIEDQFISYQNNSLHYLFDGCLDYFFARVPLILVFLSGIGFSFQTLVVKILTFEDFHATFECVFSRGILQLVISSIFICCDSERPKSPKLCGDTSFVRCILILRAVVGYGGVAFSFLAVEALPIGDATVLVMLSPLFASILGFIVLGEPWRLPEFIATIVSLAGAVLVVKPPAIFGADLSEYNTKSKFYGVVFAFIAAVCAGSAYVCVRMLGTTAKMPWSYVCFAQAIAQILMSIPSLYISGQQIRLDLTMSQCLLVFTGGFIGAWSQIAMTVGMQREKSASATAMRMSDVLFGFLWQIIFTGDAVGVLTIVGALMISTSIIIIVAFKQIDPEQRNSTGSLLNLVKTPQSQVDRQKYFKVSTADRDVDDDDAQASIELGVVSKSASIPLNLSASSVKHSQIISTFESTGSDVDPNMRIDEE